MGYWGKLGGAVAGLATGQPWMVLVGLVLGHQFDKGFASHRERPDEFARVEPLSQAFVAALFRTMGYLAKADGRVTEAEIRAARIVMHRLGLAPQQVREAILQFDRGKQPGFSATETLQRVRRECAGYPERRALFVRLLLEVALSKGRLDRQERAALWTVCAELGLGRVELAQLEAMLRAQNGFRRSAAGNVDAERLQRAYALLGVTRTSTNEEIKKAYRRLMNRNHPDKLSGGDPGVEAIAAAQKRTREIRGAYDMLKARRSIR